MSVKRNRAKPGLARFRRGKIAAGWRTMDKRPWIAVVAFACLSVVVLLNIRPGHTYVVDEIARSNVYSPKDVSWPDEAATEQLREQAAKGVTKQYTQIRGQAREAMLGRADYLFDLADRVSEEVVSRSDGGRGAVGSGSPESAVREGYDALREELGPGLAYRPYVTLTGLSTGERTRVRAAVTQALDRINTEQELRSDESAEYLVSVRKQLTGWAEAREYGLPGSEAAASAFVDAAAYCVLPNMELNEEATEQARREASAAVDPVLKGVKRGELIVQFGERVTEERLRTLEKVGLANPAFDWTDAVLRLVVLLGACGAAGTLLWTFRPDSLAGSRQLLVLSLVVFVPALCMNVASAAEIAPFVALACALASALVSTVLFGALTTAVVTGVLLLVAALVLGPTHTVALMAIPLGGTAGMIAARRLTYGVAHTFTLGLVSGLFGFFAIVMGELLFQQTSEKLVYETLGDLVVTLQRAVVAGLVGVFGGYLGNRYLEHPLGTVTEMRLLELSDPRQPLLQELLAKAPGSYHGSLLVSSLAGNAAHAAGATEREVLLVRVGALYHDIGKTRRPHMFVENQHGGHNPHDGITPTLSARTIISHVHDGVELGREHRLPNPILDCIREHHGTSLVTYFYAKAKELGREHVTEEQFRYPGPRPRSAATGILMLADGVEAAVRALGAKATRNAIETTVEQIVNARISDGQLDACPLTMQQLKDVQSSLIASLLGVYHARIEYPTLRERGERLDDSPAETTSAGPGGGA